MIFFRGFTAFLVVLLLGPVAAQSVLVQKLDGASSVDWGRLVVRSVGNSAIAAGDRIQRMEALERAKLAAEENLFGGMQHVSLLGTSRIGDVVDQNSLLQAELKSLSQTFTILDMRSMSDMSVEVDVELPLTGDLMNLVLPRETGKAQLRLSGTPLCPCCGQPWPAGRPVQEGVKLIIPSDGYTSAKGAAFTGLVIDARELDVKPALLPKILSESGEEIYGTNYVIREEAKQIGLVAYRKGIDVAVKDMRVGPMPLVIRALQTGAAKTDIVVSDIDGVLIHAAAKNQNFLNQCRVVVVF